MKTPLFLLIASTAALYALETPRRHEPSAPVSPLPEMAVPDDPRLFVNNPTGGGLAVEGQNEVLQSYTSASITFPADMVGADKIDAEGQPSPVEIWPALDATFIWRTPSEGNLMVNGPFIPGQTYRFRLREGLKDLAGHTLPVPEWGFEMTTAPLRVVEEGYGERDALNSRPQIPLEFNYPIRLSDAAQGIWMQDRATRDRYPVEILLNRPTGEVDDTTEVKIQEPPPDTVTDFRVRPLEPLPVGKRYDLVIDGVCDAYAGRKLPYLRVFPLGTTQPLKIDYVAARNFPLETPRVEIKFHQILNDDPLPPGALGFSPEVSNLRLRKDGNSIIAEGKFNTNLRYTVTVNPEIVSAGGYGLTGQEKWGATFHPKMGTVLFPARQIRERSILGLSMAFYQVNTTQLEWKLAPIPLGKLATVQAREKEFSEIEQDAEGQVLWTEEGVFQYRTSEPLIASMGLAAIASGTIDADMTGKEVLREITWKPQDPSTLEGPMLLEVTGKDAKGRLIGNRAVIYFGEAAVTRKSSADQTLLRAVRLTDGQPIAAATLTALDASLREIATQTTDNQGLAAWNPADIAGCVYFLVQGPGVRTLQPLALAEEFRSGSLSARPPPPLRSHTLTDRTLYRPGQTVHFKGFIREEMGGDLSIPDGKPVKWTIQRQYGDEVLAEGETRLDKEGGWHSLWTPPEDAPLGSFVVKVALAGQTAGSSAGFQIEEFRNPPFSVICEEEAMTTAAESVIKVASQYFHGAPNVGSRVQWTATWTSDSSDGYYDADATGMTRVDLYSEKVKSPTYLAEVSGETALDANGQAVLRCKAPFTDPGNRAASHVSWKVDVTGPDGQTITGGTTQSVPMAPVLLGVKAEDARGKVAFVWDAKEIHGPAPKAVNVDLFHVVTKSVKERLARNVYRYRNFDQYVPVTQLKQVTDSRLEFSPGEPGRYVVVVSPLEGQPGFPVSEEAWLSGERESEVPVKSETSATVFSVNGGRPGSAPWKVGETAAVNVLSPSGGIAWVSVETGKILDTFTMPIRGNTTRIDIPVKPEYEPNVFVSVYVLKPGGTDQLAGEMFGSTELSVIAPDRKLSLMVTTGQESYEPREKITGEVSVSAGGKPVANADLAIYAVDDSLLTLGGWELPEMIPSFFPARSLAVVTYTALKAYVDKVEPSWLTMKGFVAGDGGGDEVGNTTFTRKEFQPLILWQPSVKTNAQGVAKFTCDAPDNLTRFRVIAVGQTKANQFGAGDATFTVTKRLMVEPALPRFLREGDEVELRAVVRQKTAPEQKVAVLCTVGGSLELIGEARREASAIRDIPTVLTFKARAKSPGEGTVKFQAAATEDPKTGDAVEVVVPVTYPVILKKESVAGTVGHTTFLVPEIAPGEWEQGSGTFSLAVSTTPWLPKLMGLPYLLEYPHGCFEQKSSKLLGYTYLAGLLAYLPDAQAREKNYENIVVKTLDEIAANLLPDGRLPYWPGGVTPNNYVTIQAAWCASQAEKAGFEVPEQLANALPETLNQMALGAGGLQATPSLRAFAFFVLSTFGEAAGEELQTAANDLYLKRDQLTGEGRAMLALALSQWKISPEHQKQLVEELPRDFAQITFNPETFASATRTEALCAWARLVIAPGAETAAASERLNKLLESSQSLSTQENLWLLVAFDAMLKKEPVKKITSARPRPQAVASNGSAVSWTQQDLAKLAAFVVKGLPASKPPGSFVLSAAYRTPGERATPLLSHGMKIERVVKNLTEASRDGSAGAPFQLGDQILISYRFSSEKAQSYVALEDLLPAGLEVVNPNLALFGKYYAVPEQPGTTADLSYSELRDTQTNLYFDEIAAGPQSYSVLARATAAGTFIWPATQIIPMYDGRFFGRSPSSVCAVQSP